MKVGLYWEAGYFQAVLTPENEHEKKVCGLLERLDVVQVKRGGFYACQGGWIRQSQNTETESVMLILEDKKDNHDPS